MEKLLINTPQNVRIEYKLASIGNRFMALAVDLGIMICYGYFIYYFMTKVIVPAGNDQWLIGGVFSFLMLPIMFYHFFQESFFGGQTLGKMALKIKVVRIDGSRASIYEYFIRWTLNLVDIWLMSGVIGVLSIIFSKNNQRLGDMAAGTSVISLKPQLQLNETVYEDLADTYVPAFPEILINKLSDRDLNIIKSSFRITQSKQDPVILHELVRKIEEVTGIEQKDLSDAQFINKVMQDHYYYNSQE